MTAIIDYGVGNLFSLASSLRMIGEDAVIAKAPADLKAADRIILPGVGAFKDAAQKLRNSPLFGELTAQIESGKPVLGICLGMQLLFDKSFEYGEFEGLGLIRGSVVPIRSLPGFEDGLKIPHIGWNSLKLCGDKHPIFKYISDGDFVYFVHSFCAAGCEDSVIAATSYGAEITAAAANKNVIGTQFHPEKSGEAGLRILRAFCELKKGDL